MSSLILSEDHLRGDAIEQYENYLDLNEQGYNKLKKKRLCADYFCFLLLFIVTYVSYIIDLLQGHYCPTIISFKYQNHEWLQ